MLCQIELLAYVICAMYEVRSTMNMEPRTSHIAHVLFRLPMQRVFPAMRTILHIFQAARIVTPVLFRRVIPIFTLGARQGDNWADILFRSHKYPVHRTTVKSALLLLYCKIFVITPAPTVKPPSRIANFEPCSRATGTIRSTSRFTLSPGMTISTPSGSLILPVTSMVRI